MRARARVVLNSIRSPLAGAHSEEGLSEGASCAREVGARNGRPRATNARRCRGVHCRGAERKLHVSTTWVDEA